MIEIVDYYGDIACTAVLDHPMSTRLIDAKRTEKNLPVLERIANWAQTKYDPERYGMGGARSTDEFRGFSIRIHSPYIINALRSMVSYYPEISLEDEPMTMYEPAALLHHYRSNMVAYRNEPLVGHSAEYKEECNKHIDVLLNYIDNFSGVPKQSYEQHPENTVAPAMVSFAYLWLLFKSGETIYHVDEGCVSAYVVHSVEGQMVTQEPRTSQNRVGSPYWVYMWNLDFDGVHISRSMKVLKIPYFDGEREVTSLDVFPVRFYKGTSEGKSIHDQLIERGEKFFKIAKGSTFKEYNGRGVIGKILVSLSKSTALALLTVKSTNVRGSW